MMIHQHRRNRISGHRDVLLRNTYKRCEGISLKILGNAGKGVSSLSARAWLLGWLFFYWLPVRYTGTRSTDWIPTVGSTNVSLYG